MRPKDVLRNSAVEKPVAEEWQSKPAELERVARFTALLEASEYRFDEVERLRQQGKRGLAVQALSKFSEEEIDGLSSRSSTRPSGRNA